MQNNGIVHGAFDFGELERLGLDPALIIDFSVNSNPYGPSPQAQAALAGVNLARYPDRECLELRRAILEYDIPGLGLSLNQVVCGNGTAELIWAVARAFLRPGRKAAIVGPTFGEYFQASRVVGAEIVEFMAQPELFSLYLPALLSWLENEKPALLWLCNPNNPTGQVLLGFQVRQLAEFCRAKQIILVVDEAYLRFSALPTTFSALNMIEQDRPNLITLRSLTKDYALAGLRLGYAASNPQAIEAISRQLPSWNVNAAAQAVGEAALQDQAHLAKTLAALSEERLAFFKALDHAGLDLLPSATHFALVEVGNFQLNGGEVRRKLLEKRLLVRDCASFGLPNHIRVATRPQADWQLLVAELKIFFLAEI